MMEKQKTPLHACIPGGDGRMLFTAKLLRQAGCTVTLNGQDGAHTEPHSLDRHIAKADLVVLPLPITRDKIHLYAPATPDPIALNALVASIPAGAVVAGGGFSPAIADPLIAKGCRIYDCLADRRFADPNALATAEGAIAMAITEYPALLNGCDTAVLGYGKIADHLCRLLQAMGAKVTVYARRQAARKAAKATGAAAYSTDELAKRAADHDLLFNTIPARLFEVAEISIAEDSLLIDLAPVYCASEHPRILPAPGIPARYAPRFAGELYGRCILAHLQESGVSL